MSMNSHKDQLINLLPKTNKSFQFYYSITYYDSLGDTGDFYSTYSISGSRITRYEHIFDVFSGFIYLGSLVIRDRELYAVFYTRDINVLFDCSCFHLLLVLLHHSQHLVPYCKCIWHEELHLYFY